jgi:hypothetical protein
VELSTVFLDPDGDLMEYSFEVSSNFTVTIQDGLVTITPKKDWTGSEEMIMTASDGDGSISIEVRITIDGINDPPSDPQIIGRTKYVEGGDQTVTATVIDPDLLFGDELTFTWSSDVTGIIGTGKTINLSLPAGKHTITLTVTDSSGESVSTTLEIDVDEEAGKAFPWWIPVLIAIGILLIIGAILFFTKKKAHEEEPDTLMAPEVASTDHPISPVEDLDPTMTSYDEILDLLQEEEPSVMPEPNADTPIDALTADTTEGHPVQNGSAPSDPGTEPGPVQI